MHFLSSFPSFLSPFYSFSLHYNVYSHPARTYFNFTFYFINSKCAYLESWLAKFANIRGKNTRKKEQLVLACMLSVHYTCISAAHRRCSAVLCILGGPSSLVPCCGVISVGPEELMKSGACVCMITVGRGTKGRAHEDNRCQFTACQPMLLLCIKRHVSLCFMWHVWMHMVS